MAFPRSVLYCMASSCLKSALVISRVQAMWHNPANPALCQEPCFG